MKENTKFLWMYVGILFSFALILIIFAGLSQSNDAEEKKGLKSNIVRVTEENTQLKKEKSDLEKQVTTLTDENAVLQNENAIDDILLEAVNAKKSGDTKKVSEIISTIDPSVLTELQLYIYNGLTD